MGKASKKKPKQRNDPMGGVSSNGSATNGNHLDQGEAETDDLIQQIKDQLQEGN